MKKHLHRGPLMTPTYVSWKAMRNRCHNPKNNKFHQYGAKGIEVCPQWRESFEAFLADVGERPTRLHSLERLDNNLGYEPGNVKWATAAEQGRNRSNNRKLTLDGRTQVLTDWAAEYSLPRQTLEKRLARGLPLLEALTMPKQKPGPRART